ncbi:uncharacterized protein LOC123428078 [Hordeum vulgare subsp. vulgare]|uniref:Uncharacterized protein n=1 Tax=Hordeum vulgare subsp. vulgare TaxID=112509 RepID=A0A8I6X7U4_HORVV|nr:uncharacterized protein LOC123428078 [Hordeum vulgare subsp. vulgare]
MASLFGARRRRSPEDEGDDNGGDRSGSGRSKRRRLSPEGALVPAEAGRSPGWLSTIVTGAKRVISSVLFSSSEEQASEDEDGDEEEEDGSREDSDGNEDTHDTHETLIPFSESKLAIEEMVMKETFSRDECDKMVKLLQSRVTDSGFPEAYEHGTPKETPSRNGHDFTGAWRSLNRNRNGSGSGPVFSTGPGNFSPGSPLQASPELCNAAVMEAKKWLEEKRQGLGSKPEDHGPCILNTDVLNSDLKSDKGSPVDLARSYMQSLPPWQSPLLGSRRFKSPPSGGVHINDDEGSRYLSSSKVDNKEDFLSSSNFWENFELRRDRIRFSETAEASKSRHHGSTSRLFDNGVSILSPHTRDEVGQSVQGYEGSDKVAAAEPANECPLPISPTKDGNHGAVDSVDPPPKDGGNLVQDCHAASDVHPDEVPQGNADEVRRGNADEVPQGNADEVPHESPVPLTSATEEAADHSGDVKSVPAEPEIHEELHMNSTSESKAKDSVPQTRMSLRSLKKKVHSSLNGPTKKASANGLLDRSDNSGIESSGNDNPSCTNSSSAVPPNNKEFINSAADASASADNSVDNGAGTGSEKPADGKSAENGAVTDLGGPAKEDPKPAYIRRGPKRAARRAL